MPPNGGIKKAPQPIFQCVVCDATHPSIAALDEHVEDRHTVGSWRCIWCSRSFILRIDLKEHQPRCTPNSVESGTEYYSMPAPERKSVQEIFGVMHQSNSGIGHKKGASNFSGKAWVNRGLDDFNGSAKTRRRGHSESHTQPRPNPAPVSPSIAFAPVNRSFEISFDTWHPASPPSLFESTPHSGPDTLSFNDSPAALSESGVWSGYPWFPDPTHQVDGATRIRQAPESYDRLPSPRFKPSNTPVLFDTESHDRTRSDGRNHDEYTTARSSAYPPSGSFGFSLG